MDPYAGLAPYYDLLYEKGRGIDFAGDDAALVAQIRRYVPGARSLLEVACGTGIHLANLRRDFEVVGVDLSPAMLRIARRRLPGVPLHRGDFLDFALRRRFDVVLCLFSSIAYARTPVRLRRAVANLAAHLAPGGLLVVDGWLNSAAWTPGLVSVDQAADGEATVVRVSRSSSRGRLSIMDWDFLVARRGRIDHFSEHHECGLFEPGEYVAAFEAAGLRVDVDPEDCYSRGPYFGRRP